MKIFEVLHVHFLVEDGISGVVDVVYGQISKDILHVTLHIWLAILTIIHHR